MKFRKPRSFDTCTVLMSGSDSDPSLPTGVRQCGKPAAVLLTSSLSGDLYAECREHTTTDALAAVGLSENPHDDLRRGARVKVHHAGKVKVGRIVEARRTRATVEVPLADGTTKNIERPINELRPA